jgi:metal-responsive CopG/Arc/MetJ family transcriptional regulator
MVTIHLVFEPALLKAIDRTARRLKLSRSAFIRQALRSHLRALQVHAREEADRTGYQRLPESTADLAAWDRVAEWPTA